MRLGAAAVIVVAVAGRPRLVCAQASELRLDKSGQWTPGPAAAPAPGTDEALIAEARRELAEDRPEKAKDLLDDFIDTHKDGEHPLLAQAYLLRGDAITAMGNEFKALYDYDKGVIERFPGSPEYVTALERELEIGIRYVNGLRYTWLGVRIWDASDIGEEILIRIQERLPGSRLAERAGIELADFYYRKRDLELAAVAYDLFLQNYPNSQYRMKAMERRVYAAIARFKGPRYDGSTLIDAQVLIRKFSSLYPEEASKVGLDESLTARLEESAAAEMLETARWYIKQGDPVSARYVLTRLVSKYRPTASANAAIEMMQKKGWLDSKGAGDAGQKNDRGGKGESR